jgi:hypothetical protein
MSLQIEIPEPLAEIVTNAAKSRGASPEDLVLQAVADSVDPLGRLRNLAAPVAERLKELGETEDDAVEFFEEVKHDLRRQRRNASP